VAEKSLFTFRYRRVHLNTPQGVVKGWELWLPNEGRWQLYYDPRDREVLREVGLLEAGS
jgi:hypothetical protein